MLRPPTANASLEYFEVMGRAMGKLSDLRQISVLMGVAEKLDTDKVEDASTIFIGILRECPEALTFLRENMKRFINCILKPANDGAVAKSKCDAADLDFLSENILLDDYLDVVSSFFFAGQKQDSGGERTFGGLHSLLREIHRNREQESQNPISPTLRNLKSSLTAPSTPSPSLRRNGAQTPSRSSTITPSKS